MEGLQPDPETGAAIAGRFAQACLEVFGAEAVQAVIWHGSAVKGGFIPGFSDFDVQVYLAPGQFGPYGIGAEKAFAIQQHVDGLGVREAGFSYFQGYFLNYRDFPPGWVGPVPGSYRVAYGKMPEGAEGTDEGLRQSAFRVLADARRQAAYCIETLSDSHDDALRRRLRLLATVLTPTVFSVISYDQSDLRSLWAMDKFSALRVMESTFATDPGPRSARQFYDALLSIGPSPASPETLRSVLSLGLSFLNWVDQRFSHVSAQP